MTGWCYCMYKINMLNGHGHSTMLGSPYIGHTTPFPINALIYKPIATLGSEPKQKIQPWGGAVGPIGQSRHGDFAVSEKGLLKHTQ